MLEKQLDDQDQKETSPLFLGASRGDQNTARNALLSEIALQVEEYGMSHEGLWHYSSNKRTDTSLERTQKIMSLDHALSRDVTSLRNWVNGNGCLNREETEYLAHEQELVRLASSKDGATKQFEDWVEDLCVRYCKSFRAV